MTTMDRLQEIFRAVLQDDELVLVDELTAHDVTSWDSVAHISLMFTIEERFGVQFTDEQLSGFRNVGDLRRFLDSEAAASEGA